MIENVERRETHLFYLHEMIRKKGIVRSKKVRLDRLNKYLTVAQSNTCEKTTKTLTFAGRLL